jgi:alkanesulfonate monooxygenase SsuD/methylene tetrahydromethanopterin reductase-like flavin-dependent oxidoreductase (luciferase family)
LLEKWGGVPDHLRQNFSRYIDGDDESEFDNALDFSGGEAIAHKVWEDLDSDTLCERGVVIAGDPDDCIRALKKHEETGIDQMMVMMQTETVPHAEVMESIELWGKYIIPEFNK